MLLATVEKRNYCWGFYHILFWNKELETSNCQIDIMPYVSLYTSPFDAAFTGEKSYKPEITENELGFLLREALHQGHLWLLHSLNITLLPWLIYSDTRLPAEGHQFTSNHGVTESSIWCSGRVHLALCWSCMKNGFNQVTSRRNQVLWKWENIY